MTKCPSKKDKKTKTNNNYSTISTKSVTVDVVEDREKSQVSADSRFEIIEGDTQLQKDMNPKAYHLVKKYFHTISRTKNKNYTINGNDVSSTEVINSLEQLRYRDLVDITNKVSVMMNKDDFSIQSH